MSIGVDHFKIENALDYMSRLKGAPSLVLMLLGLARQQGLGPVNSKWLSCYSDYNAKTITQALNRLEQFGLVKQVQHNHWQLNDEMAHIAQSWQTPSPDPAMPDEANEHPADAVEQREAVEQPDTVEQRDAVEQREAVEIFAEEISTPKISPLSSSSNPDSCLDSRNENLPARSRPPDPKKFRDKNEVLAELDLFGIHEPARTRLAEMAHVTPALVRGHCRSCESTGLAIFRIEHNWAVKGGGGPDEPVWEDPGDRTEASFFDLEEQETPPVAPPEACRSAWSAAVSQLQHEISAAEFISWVQPARLVEAAGPVWCAVLANRFAVERFVAQGWAERLGQILSQQRGEDTRVQMAVGY